MAKKIFKQWQVHLCNWFGHHGWTERQAMFALSHLEKDIIRYGSIATSLKHGVEGHKNGDRKVIQDIIRNVERELDASQKARLAQLR